MGLGVGRPREGGAGRRGLVLGSLKGGGGCYAVCHPEIGLSQEPGVWGCCGQLWGPRAGLCVPAAVGLRLGGASPGFLRRAVRPSVLNAALLLLKTSRASPTAVRCTALPTVTWDHRPHTQEACKLPRGAQHHGPGASAAGPSIAGPRGSQVSSTGPPAVQCHRAHPGRFAEHLAPRKRRRRGQQGRRGCQVGPAVGCGQGPPNVTEGSRWPACTCTELRVTGTEAHSSSHAGSSDSYPSPSLAFLCREARKP